KCPDWKGGKVSGLEGGKSVWSGRGGKCPEWKGVKTGRGKVRSGRGESVRNWKGGKVSGVEGGESVRRVESVRGKGGKCPEWKGVKVSGLEGGKVSGLEGGESVRTGRGESVRTGRGGKCPDLKWEVPEAGRRGLGSCDRREAPLPGRHLVIGRVATG
ncbi:unnamed protein product, partial [Staurois parvus]